MQGLSLLPRGAQSEAAIVDLTADAQIGLVLKISGVGVDVPAADADIPFCVLVRGAKAGEEAGVVTFGNTTGETPLRASGAGSKGDFLCMQVVGTAPGATRKKPTAGGGTVYVYGQAKEDFVDGQLFRADTFTPRPETVAG